jgi:type II restriction/modification system DNA methylase subunit YeeA
MKRGHASNPAHYWQGRRAAFFDLIAVDAIIPLMPTLTPREFVDKWRHATLKERSASQEHFIDVCRLIGHATPAEADRTGESFAFEVGADKAQGGSGFADVWKKGFFAWEYKGKHADLDKAYQQLLQYREALQNPPLMIVSDIDRIIIHTNFTNSVKRIHTLTLDDLLTSDGLRQLSAIFTNPDFFKAPQTPIDVTKDAAADFARLADQLRKYGAQPQQAAHFLIRLIFCMFSEDAELLPNAVFSKLIEQTRRKPTNFAPLLKQLFGAMATGGWFGTDQIPHFNGGLFDDDTVLDLDSDSLDILARVSKLDWSSIEPSIFGTLFVRSLDPAQRAQLGAQYTSKEDILLIVEPVLMAPLRRKWIDVQGQARDLATQRNAATGAKKTKIDKQLRDLLIGFATELASTQVLDPACGSGNFLYVALKLLLDLWKEVSNFMAELGFTRMMPAFSPSPSPQQLHGIEINAYAHELAQITIWIGYIQWLRDNGFGVPSEPILQPIETVKQMDAILDPSSFGNSKGLPREPAWPKADVILGNPPFLGGKKLRTELGDEYVKALFDLYADRVQHEADLVCYWFERARDMIESGKVKRAGLLATQSIRAGASRKVLERIKQTGDIFYAQSDRPWILDGAAVRVSMIGFDNGSETKRLLNESKDDPVKDALVNARAVTHINANLTSESDVTQGKRLLENSGICFQGPVKVGAFDIETDLAQKMLKAHNPNRRSNSEVVKPWMNASDLTGQSRNIWIIDFGEMSLEEAAQFEVPFEYVKKNVKPFRDKNNDRQRRTFWWRLGRSGSDLRNARANKARMIITPRVAKYRVFVWADDELVPDSRLFAFARDDDYFFGVLHSRLHEVWSLATSSRHGVGNDPTYNNSTCFETFPFPWSPGQEPSKTSEVLSDDRARRDDRSVRRSGKATQSTKTSEVSLEQAIAAAARELVQLRDNWLNPSGASEAELKKRTLTNLYNERPTWLDNAHRKLDAAVFEAYGWPSDLSDEDILSKLLTLNLERAKNQE